MPKLEDAEWPPILSTARFRDSYCYQMLKDFEVGDMGLIPRDEYADYDCERGRVYHTGRVLDVKFETRKTSKGIMVRRIA